MVSGQRVIAISEFIRDYITHYYRQVDHKRIEVIPRGVDTTRYFADFVPDDNWLDEWRRTQIPLDNKFVIALPARLTRWKGQLEFIELLRRLRADDEAVAGVIIGAVIGVVIFAGLLLRYGFSTSYKGRSNQLRLRYKLMRRGDQ